MQYLPDGALVEADRPEILEHGIALEGQPNGVLCLQPSARRLGKESTYPHRLPHN